jgi:hypothetical protein
MDLHQQLEQCGENMFGLPLDSKSLFCYYHPCFAMHLAWTSFSLDQYPFYFSFKYQPANLPADG